MFEGGSGLTELANQSVLVALARLRALVASGKCSCEILEDIDRQVQEIRRQLGLPQGGGTALGPTHDGGDPEG